MVRAGVWSIRNGSRRMLCPVKIVGCSVIWLLLHPHQAIFTDMVSALKLQLTSQSVCRILTHTGLHVGNLKLIGGVWKFKAIGYDATGQVLPGGGPLTDKHNQVFAMLDEAEINQILG